MDRSIHQHGKLSSWWWFSFCMASPPTLDADCVMTEIRSRSGLGRLLLPRRAQRVVALVPASASAYMYMYMYSLQLKKLQQRAT